VGQITPAASLHAGRDPRRELETRQLFGLDHKREEEVKVGVKGACSLMLTYCMVLISHAGSYRLRLGRLARTRVKEHRGVRNDIMMPL
jgi:hypothetical protein